MEKLSSIFNNGYLLGVLIIIAILLPQLCFISTLSKRLRLISKKNRTMRPWLVWINIIPVISSIWFFYTIISIYVSTKKESVERGLVFGGSELGMGLCYAGCNAMLIIMGEDHPQKILIGIALLVFWVIYWVKIAQFNRKLTSETIIVPSSS